METRKEGEEERNSLSDSDLGVQIFYDFPAFRNTH